MSKLLMFDFDGVIVDSLQHFTTRFLRGCCRAGIDAIGTREDFLDLFDGNLYERMEAVGIGAREMTAILGTVEEGLAAALADVQPFPGMKRSLEGLAGPHVLLVISSNVTRLVEGYLEAHGISCFCEVLGGDLERSKRRKIIAARRRFPALQPYYIGDTGGDIAEGRAAGVATVAVAWGWHSVDRLNAHKPDHLVQTPAELQALLA